MRRADPTNPREQNEQQIMLSSAFIHTILKSVQTSQPTIASSSIHYSGCNGLIFSRTKDWRVHLLVGFADWLLEDSGWVN